MDVFSLAITGCDAPYSFVQNQVLKVLNFLDFNISIPCVSFAKPRLFIMLFMAVHLNWAFWCVLIIALSVVENSLRACLVWKVPKIYLYYQYFSVIFHATLIIAIPNLHVVPTIACQTECWVRWFICEWIPLLESVAQKGKFCLSNHLGKGRAIKITLWCNAVSMNLLKSCELEVSQSQLVGLSWQSTISSKL